MLQLTARQIMNHEVFTFPEDSTVVALAEFLMEKSVSGVLVVDQAGKPVGVVSATDLTEEIAEGGEATDRPTFFSRGEERRFNPEDVRGLHVEDAGRLVRDIMTPTVYTIPDDTPVPAIARTMVAGRVHRLFVARAGRVVGIIAALDLIKVLADEGTWPHGGEPHGARPEPLEIHHRD